MWNEIRVQVWVLQKLTSNLLSTALSINYLIITILNITKNKKNSIKN